MEHNLIHSVKKQHMAFFKDFMNGSKKWRQAKESSWAILSDHVRLKKKIFYGIGYGFSWHTAIINALQWQLPPPSALPHPPALTVLCKPWEIALSQAWARSAHWCQQSKRMLLPQPCQRLPVQSGEGTGQLQRQWRCVQAAGGTEQSLSSDQDHRKPDSAESQL